MSSLIGNIGGSLIQAIVTLLFFKEISCLGQKSKKITIRDFAFLLVLSFAVSLIYEVEYSSINPVMSFLSIVFCLIVTYNLDLSKSLICSGLFMLFLFASDIIASIILVSFFDIEMLRGVPIYMIISNLLVGMIVYILMKINFFKAKIIQIIETSSNRENAETAAFIILFLMATGIILYIISNNYIFNKIYILCILGLLIFIILSIIFLKEKNEKEKIINKYDQLFEYVKNFEEWMDTESINIHESKNQLAALRDIVKKNKKAVDYIDNIIKERINIESKNIQKLKYIPKGGLKGLLYYKITIAENNDINLFIDISNKVEEKLGKLNTEENKLLCRLIGIYFDNAIEAAKESVKKSISCEIYMSEKNLVIALSNSFSGKVELNKISLNGYSTKGKNRGKGLYLAKKFSKKSETIKLENRIINDYYIQKIILKEI